MDKELLLFILMVGSFMISCFALKLPSGMGMVIAAVVGALAGGFGVPVKQLVEGSMSMLDTVLVIAAAASLLPRGGERPLRPSAVRCAAEAAVLAWCVLSFTGITSFIYSNF